MKQTYQTDHPTIKEISIGDQFVTYGGDVITFFLYAPHEKWMGVPYPFDMSFANGRTRTYNLQLGFSQDKSDNFFDIKHRYIPLKHKLIHL